MKTSKNDENTTKVLSLRATEGSEAISKTRLLRQKRVEPHLPRNDGVLKAESCKLKAESCKLKAAKGFTLIELMIVVVIIVALASMVVPRLSGRTEQAKKAVAKADINSNISMALKLYELDNGNFPTTDQGLNALAGTPSSAPVPANWNGPYLESIPVDPWGSPYKYKCPGTYNKTTYDLYSIGKDGLEESDDDIKNWK